MREGLKAVPQSVVEVALLSRRELLVVGTATVALTLIALTAASLRGALWIPHNDDWVYLHMAQWLHAQGAFIVESGSLTNAVGLAVIVQPFIWAFGDSIAVLQAVVAGLGIIALVVAWLIVRQFLQVKLAALAIICLVVSPLWFPLQLSFMTDVPAFSFELLALWAALKMRGRSPGIAMVWNAIALGFAFVAFSMREYALVAGIAVLIWGLVGLVKNRTKLVALNLGLGAIWIIACILLYKWRTSLPLAGSVMPAASAAELKASIVSSYQALLFVGLFSLPVSMVISPLAILKRLSNLSRVVYGVLVLGFIALGIYAYGHGGLVLGNYLTEFGGYAGTMPLGSPPSIFSPRVMNALMLLGGASCLLLLLVLVGALSHGFKTVKNNPDAWSSIFMSPSGLLGLFGAGTLLGIFLVNGATTAPIFDRYFLPLLMVVPALALNFASDFGALRHRLFVTCASLGLALTVAVSVITVDSINVVDGGKWRIAEQLVSDGISPGSIDGGYEWFGYHQTVTAHPQHTEPTSGWWTTLYADPKICAAVGLSRGIPQNGLPFLKTLQLTNIIGQKFDFWATSTNRNCT
jgi:hypothetical protein